MRQVHGRTRTMLRAAHVIVSVGWLGLVVAMLAGGISGAVTSDATLIRGVYALLARIGGAVIPAFAVGAVLTGVVLSATTRWGLLRHYWVVAKILLSVAVVGTGARLTGLWLQQAIAQTLGEATAGAGGRSNVAWLLVGASSAHVLMLAFATVISVDKPWGPTPRGRRLAAERTARRSRRTAEGQRELSTAGARSGSSS